MTEQTWLELRRAAIQTQWQTYPSAALQKIIEARMIATINARQIPEEGTMTKMIVNLRDETVVEFDGCVVVDWQGFEGETPEDIVHYAEAHGRPLITAGQAPMVQKTFTRQDFADRLQHHIAVGDVDLPELFAERVIDSITQEDVARLGRIDEDDLAAITLILSAAIARVTGNDHG